MSLRDRIAALIRAQGPISVAHYMTLALHDPEAGYYATRDPLGAEGDFVTAPEISQMFGEMLGLWLAEVWAAQGGPSRPLLVELGPGRGTLMADMLRSLRLAPDFLAAVEVVMVETSPTLRARQQRTLEQAPVPVRWSAAFEDAPGRPLFLVANEFFDALPIRQYVKTARGWCERMVTEQDGVLAFALAPTPTPAPLIPESRAGAPEGGVYETAPAALALAQDIARQVETQGGAALLIDYGYDALGFGETLQAVGGHGYTDILAAPGEADLSAHVDFPALAQAGGRGGAEVQGPVDQGTLLTRLGIAARARMLAAANPVAAPQIAAALARLTEPDKMGRLFKALAFLPPGSGPAPGFAA